MSINKMVKLGWDGKTYDVKMTMDVIDRLDDQVCLVKMVQQVEAGEVRLSKVAKMFTCLLNEAGAEVVVDDVFHALFGAGDWTQGDIQKMTSAIFNAIFPEPKKKSATRSTRKPAKGQNKP